jgi:hypothetical protein
MAEDLLEHLGWEEADGVGHPVLVSGWVPLWQNALMSGIDKALRVSNLRSGQVMLCLMAIYRPNYGHRSGTNSTVVLCSLSEKALLQRLTVWSSVSPTETDLEAEHDYATSNQRCPRAS